MKKAIIVLRHPNGGAINFVKRDAFDRLICGLYSTGALPANELWLCRAEYPTLEFGTVVLHDDVWRAGTTVNWN